MKSYTYGSFFRRLDFISTWDISQPFEIGHNPLPIKPFEPFSIIIVESPLDDYEIERYQLKRVKYDEDRMCHIPV